ncbi:MAG: RNA-binding protein [Desulfuromonadales bacterium]|nr:RNA-binding protein [Desulfuromonadales bacterium]
MKTKPKFKDIFISDISFEATEEDIHKLFSVCGTVRSINMVTDQRNGQFKGVAFVCMSNDAETKEAINMLDGTRLIDRCICVSAAKSKEELAAAGMAAVVETPEKKTRRKRVPKGRKKAR